MIIKPNTLQISNMKFISTLAFLLITATAFAQNNYEVVSPDKSLKAEVTLEGGQIRYNVVKDGKTVLAPSTVSMHLSDGTSYSGAEKLIKTGRVSVDNLLESPFYKKSKVKEAYNQLSFQFKTFNLVFRAYDAGVAYRFESKSKKPFQVVGEIAEFAFPEDWQMYVPYVKRKKPTLEEQFFNSFENKE